MTMEGAPLKSTVFIEESLPSYRMRILHKMSRVLLVLLPFGVFAIIARDNQITFAVLLTAVILIIMAAYQLASATRRALCYLALEEGEAEIRWVDRDTLHRLRLPLDQVTGAVSPYSGSTWELALQINHERLKLRFRRYSSRVLEKEKFEAITVAFPLVKNRLGRKRAKQHG